MTRSFRTWASSLFAGRPASRKAQPGRQLRWYKPNIDVLEDRLAPAVILVNSAADNITSGDNLITLREAINAANAQGTVGDAVATAGANTIRFTGAAAGVDINVTTGTFDIFDGSSAFRITTDITIDGTGLAGKSIVRNSVDNFRLFHVDGGNLRINDAILANGKTLTILGFGNPNGGGILLESGTLDLTNVTLKGNSTVSGGHGGGIAQTGGTLTFHGSSNLFDNNNAAGNGGGYDLSGGNSGGFANFTNNTAGANGGGYHISAGSGSLGVFGYTFKNNHAANGGFASLENVTYTFNDVTATGNTASVSGGAFHFKNSTITLGSNSLSGNTTTGSGGAIAVDGGSLTVNNSTIAGNKADSGHGGGIALVTTASTVVVNNTTIGGDLSTDGNTAAEGAGIAVLVGQLTVQNNSVIASNVASGFGGGIEVLNAVQATVKSGTVLKKNRAAQGAAIAVNGNGGKLTVDAVTFGGTAIADGNVATTFGGGVYQVGGASITSVTSSLFQNNKGGVQGGGVYTNAGKFTIDRTTFKANSATGLGGAIAAFFVSDMTITDSVLGGLTPADGNAAPLGGGLVVGIGSGVKVSFLRSTAANNDANQGGGVYIGDGTLYVTNSTISNNGGDSGAYVAGGLAVFTNSTVAFNEVAGVTRTGGTARAANSLFSDNQTSDFKGVVASQGFNLFGTNANLSGNIGSDVVQGIGDLKPLAFNDGAPTPTHALGIDSDALGSGSNALAVDPANANATLTTDQRGGPFARNFGGTVDIGAYELVDTTPPTATITAVSLTAPFTNVPVFFKIHFSRKVRPFTAANVTVGNANIVANTFSQTGPKDYIVQVAPLLDGVVTVSVAGGATKDYTGNPVTAASGTITYDTTKPTAAVTATRPPGFSNSVNPTFGFTGTDPTFNGVSSGVDHLEVRLDNGIFATATSTHTFTNVVEGNHTFQVRAVDKAGNVGDAVDYTWMIDLTLPTVTIISTPPALSMSRTPTFSYMGTDPPGNGVSSAINRYEVQIDTGAFTTAVSPFTTASLADGHHTFKVRAIDNAGNIGNPVSYEWDLDATPPTTTITAKPGLFSNVVAPTFAFTGTDPVVNDFASGVDHLETKIDNAAFVTSVSPLTLAALADGVHTFQVRAIDKAGNVGTPTMYSWTIDTVAPTITISNPSVTTTINGPVTYTVTYFDQNMGPITLSPANITLNKTGTANATVLVSGTGFTRTVTLQDPYGNGTLGFTIAAGTGADLAGNPVPASAASVTFEVTGTRTLTISQVPLPDHFLPGSTFIDLIDYMTAGTQISHNAYILIPLPTMATFDAANSTQGWFLDGNNYRFNLGRLAPGSSGRLAFAVKFSLDTPPGTAGTFAASIYDDLGGTSAVATSTISAGIFDPLRPRWQRS